MDTPEILRLVAEIAAIVGAFLSGNSRGKKKAGKTDTSLRMRRKSGGDT